MNKPNQIILNIHFVKNKMNEEGIKQWWLAEQVKVDVKTLRRWLQGKIKGVRLENAESLARALECSLKDITLTDESQLYSTQEDQKKAANLVLESSLVEKLGPIGQWNVIESLIKSTMIPNLPKQTLGQLYNELAVASWRQSKINESLVYTKKALDIARELNNQELRAKSLMSLANIQCWKGDIPGSISTYNECISLAKFLHEGNYASVLSNLGALLWEIGDNKESKKYQQKAVEIFHSMDKPVNLSIAHCQLSFVSLELGELNKAKNEAEKSIEYARVSEYKRGIEMGKLVLSEIEARQDNKAQAQELLLSALLGFKNLNIEEGFNYEFAGRISKLLGNINEAKEYFKKGIAISSEFPLYQANLYKEFALLLINFQEDITYAREYLHKSHEIYERIGAPLRSNEVSKWLETLG